jgi:hypothetical protein
VFSKTPDRVRRQEKGEDRDSPSARAKGLSGVFQSSLLDPYH